MKKRSLDINLISQLLLSIVVIVIGVVVMIFKSFGLIDIVLYISLLFYIFAFFSLITYFVHRKEGDYEILILTLINILVGSYMYIFRNDSIPMILGSGLIIYTVLMIINRGYKIVMLKEVNSFMWVVKFVITFLIAFLGILTTINLFTETTVQTLMIGYYYLSLGFMLVAENAIEIFVTEDKFKKIIESIVKEEKEDKYLDVVKEDNLVIDTKLDKVVKKKDSKVKNEKKEVDKTVEKKKEEVKEEKKEIKEVKEEKQEVKENKETKENKENKEPVKKEVTKTNTNTNKKNNTTKKTTTKKNINSKNKTGKSTNNKSKNTSKGPKSN